VRVVAAFTAFYTTAPRDRARSRAARGDKAAKVSELLTGLLTSADPYADPHDAGEPTSRGLLDAGRHAGADGTGRRAELQAQILTVMGRTIGGSASSTRPRRCSSRRS
jgi:hypothetical protein